MQNEMQQSTEDEINLKDIIEFFRRNMKLIGVCGVAGLLLATAYISLAPKRYEAQWQVQMASGSEDPAALMQRLRSRTMYPIETRQNCAISAGADLGEYLNGQIKVDAVKGIGNAVELKVRALSADQAMKCAESITKMIVVQQSALINERLAGRQDQLAQYRQSLKVEQQQLEGLRKSDIGNFGYLARLDKLSWLRTRIDALEEEAMLSQLHPTKLLAPIYVASNPVSPRVNLLLELGLGFGLFMGLLFTLSREVWRKAMSKYG